MKTIKNKNFKDFGNTFIVLLISLNLMTVSCGTKKADPEETLLPIKPYMIDLAENMEGPEGKFLGDLLKKLLAGESAQVNAKDEENYGFTALHYAAQLGSPSIIQALIARGADVNAKCNEMLEVTPLFWALYNNKGSAVRELLTFKDIDVNFRLKNSDRPNEEGPTPLKMALILSEIPNKSMPIPIEDILVLVTLLLKDDRVEVNKKSNEGGAEGTPLGFAMTKATDASKEKDKQVWQQIINALKEKGATT